MSTERILIRGTTAQRLSTTPAQGQIGSDDDIGTVVLGDGDTVGGILMARQDLANVDAGVHRRKYRSPIEVKNGGSPYAAVAADRGKTFVVADDATVNLQPAATLGDGWFLNVMARGGDVTIDPDGAEEIEGEADYTVKDGTDATLRCDGAGFHVATGGGSVDVLFTEDLGKSGGEQEQARENVGLADGNDGQVRVMDGGAPAWADSLGYVDGSFTPTVTFSTPGNLSVTYHERFGRYTRIGSRLFFEVMIDFTPTFSTASGQTRIAGLPFTPDPAIYGSGNARAIWAPAVTNRVLTLPTDGRYVAWRFAPGDDFFTMFVIMTGATAPTLDADILPSGTRQRFILTGSFMVASA